MLTPRKTSILTLILFSCWVTPVFADTVHLSNDTNINLAMPNQNNGASANVYVRNVGPGGVRHAFVKFDFSTVPPGATISQATLRLWVSKVPDPGSITLHRVLNAWDEATLTANLVGPGQVEIDPTPFATKAIATADVNSFVTVDITTVVQDWLATPANNFGIALLPDAIEDINLELDSKENTGTSHSNELEVTLAAGGGGDITGVAAGTGLFGGGASGDVTLSIVGSYQLPQSCNSGQVPKFNSGTGSWTCADDLDSGSNFSADSDKLDGLDSTQFLRSDISGTLTGNLSVTGNVGFGAVSSVSRLTLNAPNFQHLRLEGSQAPAVKFFSDAGTVDRRNWAVGTNICGDGFFEVHVSQTNTGEPSQGQLCTNVAALQITKDKNVALGTAFGGGNNRLSVKGNAAVGGTYAASNAPSDGLIVEGNVGFGTTSPVARLTISGATQAETAVLFKPINASTVPGVLFHDYLGNLRGAILHDALGIGVDALSINADKFGFKSLSGAERIRIDNVSGNVGIGTTSPVERLDVAGNLRASGSVQVGSTSDACTAAGAGRMRFNVATQTMEFCDGNQWKTIATSP